MHITNERAADLAHRIKDSAYLRVAAIEIHTESGDVFQAFTSPRRGLGYDLVRIQPGSGRTQPIDPPSGQTCYTLDQLAGYLEGFCRSRNEARLERQRITNGIDPM
jgi:hypothetical protein